MQFTYEAMSSDGRVVTDRVDGNTPGEAAEALRAGGLTVLRLEAARGGGRHERAKASARRSGSVKPGDLMLFTRQLKMLLEAGSSLVPALEAVEQQAAKPSINSSCTSSANMSRKAAR